MALSKARVPRTGATWIKVSCRSARTASPVGAAGALGALHASAAGSSCDASTLRATLYDASRAAIWRARVGVGRASLADPAGHFYVREKLRAIGSPIYGPSRSAPAPTRRS